MTYRQDIYAGGAWRPSNSTTIIPVVDPATEEVIGAVPDGTVADVDSAVRAARSAFNSWSQTAPAERADWLRKVTEALSARAADFTLLIARELGVPVSQTRPGQVDNSICDLGQMPAVLRDFQWEERVRNSLVLRVPRGVVAAITPWNFPLHQITAKFAGAVSAGCTVVVKPSEVTPLTAYLFADMLHEIGFPAGVFNLVTGTGAVAGEALVTHPEVDMISFTGSTTAGKRISGLAAAGVKPVALELGGKSAAVVLEDADLERAVEATLAKTYQNSGQTCTALTRLLVPADRLGEAEKIAADMTATYRLGDPLSPDSTLGPLANASQRDRVQNYIETGLREGAKLVTGGPETPAGFERGYYVRPTVFSEVRPEMVIAREEIFGPVLAILPYRNEREAVAMANDSDYGLSGAVWAGDQSRAIDVARQVRTGMVSINGGPFNPSAPFGGFKQSGHGRELGRFGLEEFLTYKSLHLNPDS
jgi:aldehyde dehydrogenase (NAD+)